MKIDLVEIYFVHVSFCIIIFYPYEKIYNLDIVITKFVYVIYMYHHIRQMLRGNTYIEKKNKI